MIEIYRNTNSNYDFNGDATLNPSSCLLDTSDWKLTIDIPIDENLEFITNEAVVAAPTWYSDKQLFRIYDYEKSESGITAYARPIFFDSAHDSMLMDVRPTDKTGKQALEIMTAGMKYSGKSDITAVSTAYYIRKNLIEAIMGSDENSFINRWGGQPIFDNFKIIVNKRAGGDYGAKAHLGYNLTSIEEHVNMDNVVTRIVPIGYNGYTLEGETPWVDSPNINKYAIVYMKEVKYEDVKLQEDCQSEEVGFATLSEYREELKRRAKADFDSGVDLPAIDYKVEVADLGKTAEYENIKELVKIGYGDTVEAENEALGITTTAKCVNLVYNCLTEQNETVYLGDATVSYFDKLSSTMQAANAAINWDGTVKGGQIGGLIDMFKARMKATAEGAKKQAERAILFEDIDPDSPMFGAMALGTNGFMIADERTADGRDWDWKTFGTGQGFYADFLVGGVLLSQNYIANKTGFKLDLNTGSIEAGRFSLRSVDSKYGFCSWVFEKGRMFLNTTANETEGEIRVIPADGDAPEKIQIIGTVENGKTCVFDMIPRDGTIQIMSRNLMLDVLDNDTAINGEAAETGRVEFSNGTYLDFNNGFLTGVKAANN